MGLMDFFGKSDKSRNDIVKQRSNSSARTVKLDAEERSSADSISPKTTEPKKKATMILGKSLAEMVCYYDKQGYSAEDIGSAFNMDTEDVLELITEARAADMYETLANCMGTKN